MTSAKDILTLAASQIGTKESPANSNKVKYAEEYGLNGNPWCAMFVWWVFNQAKASKLYFGGNKTAYTPTLANHYKAAKQWHSTPKAGDLVFFHNGTRICHVGLVEKVIDSNTIQTIEGNTSTGNNANGGMVMRRLRGIKGTKSWYVAGFARPAYSAPKQAAKAVYTLKRVLRRGRKGADVGTLQAELKALGIRDHYGKALVADGDFGVRTQAAVYAYQRSKKLKVDGVVGALTAKELGWRWKP